jgi:hypothetical protein
MRKVLKVIGKWILGILLGLIGLIIVLILAISIFKGKITEKALSIVNEKQPGVVQLENFRLRPLLHFPDVSLQLQELSYMQGVDSLGLTDSIPVMRMDDIYVSLNIVQLLKGRYEVSKVHFGEGEINYIIYGDSVSNLELALGTRFGGEPKEKEPKEDSSAISLNLDDLEISNLNLNYVDKAGRTDMSVTINELHSGFTYLPELITAVLDLDIELNQVEFGDIILDKPRPVHFTTALNYDLTNSKVMLDSSILDIKDAVIELSGTVLLEEGYPMDIQFNAKNTGIELLNFLLSGILDMDAIEQIGSGEIELGGTARGSLGDQLPLLTANFRAEDLGFHVKAINQDVTEINFKGTATNGTKTDFSEAKLSIDYFHATMPDGEVDLELEFANLVNPHIDLKTDGNVDLSIVNEVLDTDAIIGVKGELIFSGDIDGVINKSSGEFLDYAGVFRANMNNVSFSLPDNEIENFSGELNVAGRNVLLKITDMIFDGNMFSVDVGLFNVLPNFLGFKTNPTITLGVVADTLYLDRIISDTSLTNMFSEPIRGLTVNVAVKTDHDQFMQVLNESIFPEVEIKLSNLNVEIPGYSPISKVASNIQLGKNDVRIKDFSGMIGSSSFNLGLGVMNYSAFLEKDSAAPLVLDFQLASETMKAKELLTFNDRFMVLPETYEEEEMNNFLFKGKIETSVGELLKKSGLPQFRFTTDDIHWDFKYYPLSFRDFEIDVEHIDSLIKVNTFEGRIGESNIKLIASVANLLDSTKAMSGNLTIESDLLDINELLKYELMADVDTTHVVEQDTLVKEKKSLGLHEFDIPAFQLNVDIKELRYQENTLYGLLGQIRSIPEKIIYLDKFLVQAETGGTIMLDGQFNVIDSVDYILSSTFDIDTLNISDFDLAFSMGDSVFTLNETFTGILDAQGIAEIYFGSDMSMDLANSTAAFIISLKDGSVMNFTPLQAAAKFTGSKNLNNVKFGEIRNRFTLVDETIYVPLMSINTSLAQLGVEGEQGLDGHFMYLVRIPPALISGTAKNVITGQKKSDGADEVVGTKSGQYVVLTVSDKGVKPGDRRDKFDEEE